MTDRHTAKRIARTSAQRIVRRIVRGAIEPEFSAMERMVQQLAIQLGQVISYRNAERTDIGFHDAEFSTFSQWGEDGIIQYLLARTDLGDLSFVEFGVESYREANTRFLLMKDNWRGLIIDADSHHIEFIRQSQLAWRHDITAVSTFVTAGNINRLLLDNGKLGDIGLLSIDIDGNDYWVLKAITAVRPRIIICEYNSVFGSRRAVSVPYEPYC